MTSPTPSARDRVQPGDRVELVMRDGTHARFRVASLDGDALISEEGQRYAREDLRELKVRRPAPGRTANLALAVVTVGLLFLYIRSRPVLGDEFKAW